MVEARYELAEVRLHNGSRLCETLLGVWRIRGSFYADVSGSGMGPVAAVSS